jgi:hypothetical protein
MRIFNVITQTKYALHVKEIENIEDSGDSFLTEDEVNEITGRSWISNHNVVNHKTIKATLTNLVNKIKKSNSTSCKIEDEDLLKILKGGCNPVSVSDFVDGIRRSGNRLSLYTKPPKTKVTKSDGKQFINYSLDFISSQVNKGQTECSFNLEMTGGLEKVHEGSLRFICRNMEYDEYEEWTRSNCCKSRIESLQWAKILYNDPTYFNEVK